ncbi:cupin domain-containing protein [Pseudonocardia phyllosphaerae]|uniref:cupin domain-containing protein n=1 Tax=Pseudonocardia phyllosphaerae TaxID=3390502 RepID=UPI00397BF836
MNHVLRFPQSPGLRPIDCGAQPMFDGDVRTRVARSAGAPGEQTVMATEFAAGSSTVWHSHDTDQTLVVTAGSARLDYADGPIELQAGDVVTVPAGVPHRHLSSGDQPMTHLSVTGYGRNHLQL